MTTVDLLKIDTVQFDINVIRGAKNALSQGATRAVQFEFIPADIVVSLDKAGSLAVVSVKPEGIPQESPRE